MKPLFERLSKTNQDKLKEMNCSSEIIELKAIDAKRDLTLGCMLNISIALEIDFEIQTILKIFV